MNVRGIVESRLGNRLFIRPADCECTECARCDITQADLQNDIDKIAIGDKVESYTGKLWYKVTEFTPNPVLDFLMANRTLAAEIDAMLASDPDLATLPEGPMPSEDMLQKPPRNKLN